MRWNVKNAKWEKGTNTGDREKSIIISLTSYPGRFSEIGLCLKSLCLQSVKPDRIILWLGNDSSENDVKVLEEKYVEYGIEVRIDKTQNLLSHKKYFYVFQEFSDAIIITADDDLIYPTDWLHSLLATYEKNPDCICARRVHSIVWNRDGSPYPYREWKSEIQEIAPSHNLIATTGAGVLFPPHCFADECFNSAVFMKMARTADDLWLKIMAVLSDKKVVWVPNKMQMPTTIDLNQKDKLENINCDEGHNDVIFKVLCEHYKLNMNSFIN